MSDLLPVFWLCGPPGVGKSTIAWQLYTGLPAGAAYVDIDQLGMCYPEISEDPGRTLLEARILGDVAANVRAAGAGCLVVSGYIDSKHGIHTEFLTGGELQVLRLRCDRDELRRRLEGRGRAGEPAEFRELSLQENDALDRAGLPYPVLDSTRLTEAETLAAVRRRWPITAGGKPGPWPQAVAHPGEIVLVCGPTASGKSTVGYDVYLRSLAAGHMTGFVDLQQIGFFRGPDGHGLKAANLAAVWRRFHEHGARRMVVNGAVDRPEDIACYRAALPAATVTVYRLHAGPDALRERIRLRGLGNGPQIAGDALRGQSADVLDQAWRAAVVEAGELETAGIEDVRVDTDHRTVEEVSAGIGW